MPRRRRAVIVTRLYTPEVTAASFRMHALASALAEDGEVIALTTRPPRDTVIVDAVGVDVRRAPVLRDASGAIRGYVPYLSFDIPAFFRLIAARGDVIVAEAPPTTGLVAAIASALTGRALVYYPGDVWTDAVASMNAPPPVVATMRAIERFVLRRAAASLAVSDEVAERLAAIGGRPERVVTVGNGIDTELFAPTVMAADAERPYFVYTGTMSEWQRPDLFIRALAMIDEPVDIRFFGQGSVEAELRALAEELVPGRVHFGGLVDPATSASWIRGAVAALVSIVPGIGYDFARPTKTYAAAAVGTPVLFAGAESGGAVVREGALGETVDFSVDDVASAMRRLLAKHRDGTSEKLRAERAAWAVGNVSLRTVGRRAADVVRSARRGSRRQGK